MMKEILYILLDNYADHEIPFLAQAITTDEVGLRQNPKYANKIVAATMAPVNSISGFKMMPDYTFDTIPADYAAIVLIGGYGWQAPNADKVTPIVANAVMRGVPVGAICNAASWMASKGFLNGIKHTGNGLDQLKLWGGDNYTNEAGYVNAQAVTDGYIVTANGTGYLDFAVEMLRLLENDTPEMIDRYHMFFKMGMCEIMAMYGGK